MDPNAAPSQRVSASLYVGDLPIDLPNPEDALFSLFSKVGTVISIKVCRDINTQRSLGYAYVNFQAPADAERALETLNYTEIAPGRFIRVMWSSRDPTNRKSGSNNLFIKNLDPAINVRALRDSFSVFGTVVSCKVAMNEQGKSLGYGFVQFEKDEAAKKAITAMNGAMIGTQPVKVEQFKKKSERIAQEEKTFVSLFVKNINENTTEEDVRKVLGQFGTIEELYLSPVNPTHNSKFALIRMGSHEAAVKVIQELHEKESPISHENLFVSRALRRNDRTKPSPSPYQSQGRNIYVKHLDDSIDKAKLEELFAPFGTITSSCLMKDPAGNFRGFGFVCFENKESAAAAIREMNGKQVFRRPLYVSQAQHRDMRHRILEEQRKQFLQQQQRMTMQMYQPQPWATRYPPMGAQFMPPFMMTPAPGTMRRPPMVPRMNVPMPTRPPAIQVRGPPMGAVQRPYTQPPMQRAMPSAGLTQAQLARMTPEEQKNALGERLYARINEVNPMQAAKITGMLLEMEIPEILSVLDDQRVLLAKVHEAITVLQQHESSTH